MKLFAKKIFLLLIALLAQKHVSAQHVLAMSFAATPPISDTTDFGVPRMDSTTIFSTIMNVVLSDTDSIYQVHVKLGNTLHGTQYLSSSFDYGVDGTFGNTTYTQTGNLILLGLGSHTGLINYYAEVQIEKSDHTFEDAVLFSKN